MKLLLVCLACVALASAKPSKSGRIVGGFPAGIGDYPSVAALAITTATSKMFCEAALLDRQHLLTAAHCIVGATEIEITLGVVSLSAPNAAKYNTDTFTIHPQFNPLTLANDIAVIKTRLPIGFTDYIHPIKLPPRDITQYSELIATGWGQTDDQMPAPVDHLHYVQVAPLSDAECRRVYGNAIQPSMVCVEGNYNQGTCRGDSGAPLFEHINNRDQTIVGVSSFISQNGCLSNDPSGFTKVYPFVSWIRTFLDNP